MPAYQVFEQQWYAAQSRQPQQEICRCHISGYVCFTFSAGYKTDAEFHRQRMSDWHEELQRNSPLRSHHDYSGHTEKPQAGG
jgi:hypothetical protein